MEGPISATAIHSMSTQPHCSMSHACIRHVNTTHTVPCLTHHRHTWCCFPADRHGLDTHWGQQRPGWISRFSCWGKTKLFMSDQWIRLNRNLCHQNLQTKRGSSISDFCLNKCRWWGSIPELLHCWAEVRVNQRSLIESKHFCVLNDFYEEKFKTATPGWRPPHRLKESTSAWLQRPMMSIRTSYGLLNLSASPEPEHLQKQTLIYSSPASL